MPRRHVPFVVGEHYHLYNRGSNRQAIFFERENYLFFLTRLRHHLVGAEEIPKLASSFRLRVSVIAYCLMPNHFHLLIEVEQFPLSVVMQRLLTSYVQYFVKRHGQDFRIQHRLLLSLSD